MPEWESPPHAQSLVSRMYGLAHNLFILNQQWRYETRTYGTGRSTRRDFTILPVAKLSDWVGFQLLSPPPGKSIRDTDAFKLGKS
jgi:hypothetical protein